MAEREYIVNMAVVSELIFYGVVNTVSGFAVVTFSTVTRKDDNIPNFLSRGKKFNQSAGVVAQDLPCTASHYTQLIEPSAVHMEHGTTSCSLRTELPLEADLLPG